jgi:hypothetical protein
MSKLNTAGTSLMSSPRAATSVHTSRSTSPLLEGFQRLQAFVLALVAVQRGGFEALALQRAGQTGAAQLAVDEHKGLLHAALAHIWCSAWRLSSSGTL